MADYVIVGAGSAGCVLAGRLTEQPGVSVTLLEAGRRDSARNISCPAAFGQLFRTADDWDFATEPEPGCDDRAMYWPRGKVLGGCSSINAMIYIRGNRLDYDGWRDAGCDGWGYDDVLPYFLRSEGNTRGSLGVPQRRRAAHRHRPALAEPRRRMAYVEAAAQAGFPLQPRLQRRDAGRRSGMYQATQRAGRRCSAATAFLKPAVERREPLGRDRRAGHPVDDRARPRRRRRGDRRRQAADCSAPIARSCSPRGAVSTPQLLLLSGIGPADELASHGIEVDRRLTERRPQPAGPRERGGDRGAAPTRSRWSARTSGRGTWRTTCCGTAARSPPPSPRPAGSSAPIPACRPPTSRCCSRRRCSSTTGSPTRPGTASRWAPYLLTLRTAAARSRCASSDPTAQPLIRASYYSEPSDLDRMLAGLRICLDIVAQPALAPYVKGERFLPAAGDDTDAALRASRPGQERDDLPPDVDRGHGTRGHGCLRPAAGVRGVPGCASSTPR